MRKLPFSWDKGFFLFHPLKITSPESGSSSPEMSRRVVDFLKDKVSSKCSKYSCYEQTHRFGKNEHTLYRWSQLWLWTLLYRLTSLDHSVRVFHRRNETHFVAQLQLESVYILCVLAVGYLCAKLVFGPSIACTWHFVNPMLSMDMVCTMPDTIAGL